MSIDLSKLKFSDKVQYMAHVVNENKYISGLALLFLNFGSKYLSLDISRTQDELMSHKIFRRLTLFTVFFVGTRDLITSVILTAAFVILSSNIFHEKSKYCIIPKKYIKYDDDDKVVSEEDLKTAKKIIKQYEEQKKKGVVKKIDTEMEEQNNEKQNYYNNIAALS